jgi:hypothetical protein
MHGGGGGGGECLEVGIGDFRGDFDILRGGEIGLGDFDRKGGGAIGGE